MERILSKSEVQSLLHKGGWFVRNIYDFDKVLDSQFWFVIKDNFADMNELSSKTRNQIKRAFSTLDIRIISKNEMIAQGYPVFTASFERYKNAVPPMKETTFKKWINDNSTHTEYWGCMLKESGQLIAFAINDVKEDMCDYSTMKAIPQFLTHYYPFYGLLYRMNEYYLNECNLKYVCDGARSITEHSNIQDFLIKKFNFRKAYCHLKLHYRWWVKIAVMLLFPLRKLSILPEKLQFLLKFEAIARKAK